VNAYNVRHMKAMKSRVGLKQPLERKHIGWECF